MSHPINQDYLEASQEHFHSFLEVGNWASAKAICKDLEENGFSSESFKLTNDLLIAQREWIEEEPMTADEARDHADRMGTYPF